MAVPGLHRHPVQGVIRERIERIDRSVVERFRDVYSAFVADHFGKHGCMEPGIKPLDAGSVICGTAVTSLGPDLTVRRMAIDLMEPGDVLVVAAGGSANRACFGDGTALRMSRKDCEGVVIDGMTRDSSGLRTMGFPVFCRGTTQRNHHYPEDGEHGAVNVSVVCGGVRVEPGDLILGDSDGVLVVDRESAVTEIDKIESNLADEREMRAAMTSYVPFNVRDELAGRGYKFE
ncbi:MAG: hypothetical protein AAGF73_15225 [Actinomycetota bacterium]